MNFDEQINIFDLEVLEKNDAKKIKKIRSMRRQLSKARTFYTLRISIILENNCSGCPFNDKKENIDNSKCIDCPFYKQLKECARELERLTEHKVLKEKWESKKNIKDHYDERLYTYETLQDLEDSFDPEYISSLRENMNLVEIAEFIDCDYSKLRCYINKYNLNKRKDGTLYKKR